MITTIKFVFTQLRATRTRGCGLSNSCTVGKAGAGAVGGHYPDIGDGQRLWNLAPLIPENQRFSRGFRGRGKPIDNLFVSHGLVKAVQTATGEIEIRSLTKQPTERRESWEMGHRPVGAVFDLGQ